MKMGKPMQMNEFDERSKRDLLQGLCMTVDILEANDGFVLRMNGTVANKARAEELRREIAYLEAVLPPKLSRFS
jgi:hypothetical protein